MKSQGHVIACLERNITHVSPKCQKHLLKKEKQSNFVELDRSLYKHCETELETLCEEEKIAEAKAGRMFQCLERNKHNQAVSTAVSDFSIFVNHEPACC